VASRSNHWAKMRLTCFLAESRYALKCLPLRKQNQKASRLKKRALLREILRDVPFWAEGHMRLGMLEVLLEEGAEEARDPRAVAAIRVSAKALLQLANGEELSEPQQKSLRLQASYLLGMSHFLFREFEKAADFFYEVLDPTNVDFVSSSLGLNAMEKAGSVALALGEEEQALKYFEALPQSQRNAEIDSALSYLREKHPRSDSPS